MDRFKGVWIQSLMFRDRYAVCTIGHADMFAASDYSEPALLNALTARSEETSVKSTSGGDLYLIYRGILRLFLYHAEVCADGILDVFNGLFKCIALAVAAGEGRTMDIKSVVCFVYDDGVFHVVNVSRK